MFELVTNAAIVFAALATTIMLSGSSLGYGDGGPQGEGAKECRKACPVRAFFQKPVLIFLIIFDFFDLN